MIILAKNYGFLMLKDVKMTFSTNVRDQRLFVDDV